MFALAAIACYKFILYIFGDLLVFVLKIVVDS